MPDPRRDPTPNAGMPHDANSREAIGDVIRASWFTLDDVAYAYARVREVRNPERHLMVIRDADEITVVTAVENLGSLDEHEANGERWRLINIRCGKPFYCVGFIAAISDALAREGIDLVIASAFTNDLVLVMERDLERSVAALERVGFVRRPDHERRAALPRA